MSTKRLCVSLEWKRGGCESVSETQRLEVVKKQFVFGAYSPTPLQSSAAASLLVPANLSSYLTQTESPQEVISQVCFVASDIWVAIIP